MTRQIAIVAVIAFLATVVVLSVWPPSEPLAATPATTLATPAAKPTVLMAKPFLLSNFEVMQFVPAFQGDGGTPTP